MNKIKVIALYGKAGAGKDTCLNRVCEVYQLHKIVSATTRPPREGERDDIDYRFLTDKEFEQLEYIERTEFRGWKYGTPKDSLDANKINIGVFNPEGVKALIRDKDIIVIPVLIDASDKQRLIRQLNREENPDCEEICRRFETDKKDFENFHIVSEYDFSHLAFEYGRPRKFSNQDESDMDKTVRCFIHIILDLIEWEREAQKDAFV